jgi:hypothetical protein
MKQPTYLPDSLVQAEWLADHLNDARVRVIDIRGAVTTEDLGGGRQRAAYAGAPERYAEGHIPSAAFVDWTRDIVDLNGTVKAQIAPPETFKAAMERIGVGDDSSVVVVDDTGGISPRGSGGRCSTTGTMMWRCSMAGLPSGHRSVCRSPRRCHRCLPRRSRRARGRGSCRPPKMFES